MLAELASLLKWQDPDNFVQEFLLIYLDWAAFKLAAPTLQFAGFVQFRRATCKLGLNCFYHYYTTTISSLGN